MATSTYKLTGTAGGSVNNVVQMQILRKGRIKSVRWDYGPLQPQNITAGSSQRAELSMQSQQQIQVNNTINVIDQVSAAIVNDNTATTSRCSIVNCTKQSMTDFPVSERDIVYINTDHAGAADSYRVTCFVDVQE